MLLIDDIASISLVRKTIGHNEQVIEVGEAITASLTATCVFYKT